MDDYSVPACVRAIADFRSWHNISEPIVQIGIHQNAYFFPFFLLLAKDWTGVYWIKEKHVEIQWSHYNKLNGKT